MNAEKIETPPKFLYKYKSLEGESDDHYVEDIFKNCRFHMSAPSTFNDPFEFRSEARLGATRKQKQRTIARWLRSSNPKSSKKNIKIEAQRLADQFTVGIAREQENEVSYALTRDISADYLVLALANTPTSTLMWSHYSDSHKGICIELSNCDESEPLRHAHRVKYKSEIPTINVFTDTAADVFEKPALTKAPDWAYEGEWRLVRKLKKKDNHACEFDPSCLSSVVLGARILESNRMMVEDWVEKYVPNAIVRVATLSEHSYRLDFDPPFERVES